MTVLRAKSGLGGAVRGIALVAGDNFSARYDLDRLRGLFVRETHALYGRSYVGRILVLNTAKGGVASAWMLKEMASRGMAPLGFVFNAVNPILAQGAAFAGLPLLAGFEGDITGQIADGIEVELDGVTATLTLK